MLQFLIIEDTHHALVCTGTRQYCANKIHGEKREQFEYTR